MGCIGRKDEMSLTFQLRHEEWRKEATWIRAFQVEGPAGLREESSRLVISMEGWLLRLCEVARENAQGDEVGEGDRADLQHLCIG